MVTAVMYTTTSRGWDCARSRPKGHGETSFKRFPRVIRTYIFEKEPDCKNGCAERDCWKGNPWRRRRW